MTSPPARAQGDAPEVPAQDGPPDMTPPDMTWPRVLGRLLAGDTEPEAAAWAMDQIMSGEATPAQIAGFAVALRAKGAGIAEMYALADTMLSYSAPIVVEGHSVDLVGTGGDGAHTVNISTMAAIVAAGAGARVVKHGNRSASSLCGAADLLEELGVDIELDGAGVVRCVDEAGIGFCFAPRFHPALRYAAAPRRELGIPTAFNFLAPLTNPAQPTASAVGCADAGMSAVLAGVLAASGRTALVFHGDDGLDELTTTTTSRAWVVTHGAVAETSVDPAALGIPVATLGDLRGGAASYNAGVARDVLAGARGPARDAVLLNAAAAIAAYDGLDGTLADALARGLDRATAAVDTGAAARLLDRWVTASRGTGR